MEEEMINETTKECQCEQTETLTTFKKGVKR
jgi:hypothetical protein